MPYALKKSGQKYYVINQDTGRKFSHLPLPKERALRQMRALYASEHGYKMRSRSGMMSPFNERIAKSKGNSKRLSIAGGRFSSFRWT